MALGCQSVCQSVELQGDSTIQDKSCNESSWPMLTNWLTKCEDEKWWWEVRNRMKHTKSNTKEKQQACTFFQTGIARSSYPSHAQNKQNIKQHIIGYNTEICLVCLIVNLFDWHCQVFHKNKRNFYIISSIITYITHSSCCRQNKEQDRPSVPISRPLDWHCQAIKSQLILGSKNLI